MVEHLTENQGVRSSILRLGMRPALLKKVRGFHNYDNP